MPKHGAPDWYRYRRTSTTFPTADLAELAVRLGSPVTHDRRGDVIYIDDFEDGLAHCGATAIGTGSSATLDPTTSRLGGYACALTAGEGMTTFARLDYFLPYPVLSKLGFECAFTISEYAGYLRFSIPVYTGANSLSAVVRYNVQDDELDYVDENNAYVSLATDLNLRQNINTYHIIKIVLDPDALEYVRVILDATAYALPGIPCRVDPDTTAPHLRAVITASFGIGAAATTYIDGIIITQDEP